MFALVVEVAALDSTAVRATESTDWMVVLLGRAVLVATASTCRREATVAGMPDKVVEPLVVLHVPLNE